MTDEIKADQKIGMKKDSASRMGTDPILPLIVKMSLPAMFSMLIQAMYNIVDSMYVAQLSQTALNAVSLIGPAQNINMAFNIGTGIGVSSLISRRLGQGRVKDAENAISHGIIIANCEWLLFALFGIFGAEAFCRAFTSDAALIAPAVTYCRIVQVGSIMMFNATAGERVMQGCGNMIYTMWCQIIGAVTNIILDPIMIFGKFGLPAMGVAGAAYATVIGQACAAIATYLFMYFGKFPIKITFKGFKFHWQTVKDIFKVGLPSIINQSIISLTTMFMNKILIAFTQTAVGVLGVYFRLQSFIFMPVFGMNQGVMPIMGYNFGAKNKERLIKTYKTALILALCIMCIGMVVFQLMPETLMSIFKAEDEMLEIGHMALTTISFMFPMTAINIMSGTLFSATAHGMYSLITTFMRQLFVIIPLAYIFSKTFGLAGVWWAYPIAEFVSLIVTAVLIRSLFKKEINPMPDKQN